MGLSSNLNAAETSSKTLGKPNSSAQNFSSGVIPYKRLKTALPDRNYFLDPQQVAQVDNTIAEHKQLMFLPTYLTETNMQDIKYSKAVYKIVLMGILTDGRRVNVILDGIEPYFEVRIPHATDPIDESLRSAVCNLPDVEGAPKKFSRAGYINLLREKLNKEDLTTPTRVTIIKSKPFKYYRENQSEFVRFYYSKTKNRQTAINLLRKDGYETASDDLNSYYRVVCRDYLTSFSSWVTLDDYSVDTHPMYKGTTIRVNIKNYRAYTGKLTQELLKDKTLSASWDVETYSPTGAVPKPENVNDKIFCLSLTYQWVNQPEPFMKLCFCDMPANSKEGFTTIVCGSETNIIRGFAESFEKMRPEFMSGFNDSDYDWDWIIKRSAQTKGLLTYIAERFDSSIPYAQPVDASVAKYNIKKEHIKLEATSYIDGVTLQMPGYIPVDVRTIYRKIYPTAEESSLKFFLKKNKLGGKEDMPISTLFAIYADYNRLLKSPHVKFDMSGASTEFTFAADAPNEILQEYARLKEDLALVNSYCVTDAQRCHDLMRIRSVIMDHREVSNLAYTSMYDAFYRANGMKVRNLTIAKGQKSPFNIRFTNIGNYDDNETGKYPGAYVFPPKKGLKVSKLSIAERIKKAGETHGGEHPACQEWLNTPLDAPDVQQAYEIVEQYGACIAQEEISSIEKDIQSKIPKRVKDFLVEPIGRPITGLDFSSLYPSLIRCYNFSPEYCVLDRKYAKQLAEQGVRLTKVDFEFSGTRRVAWFVHHNNNTQPFREEIIDGKTTTVPNENFQFGVYPTILNELFNKRAGLKKEMKPFSHKKEEIEGEVARLVTAEFARVAAMELANDPEVTPVDNSAAIKREIDRMLNANGEYQDICFELNYRNSKQNALKVFMNTFYGEAGNRMSPFFVLEVAGGITQYGKENIQLAFKTVSKKGCNVYYGDSVTADTPVFIRRNGRVKFVEIQDLIKEGAYEEAPLGKELGFPENLEVWSDAGFIKVNKVIRHKTDKKISKILTHTGSICVTSDHSLLNIDGISVAPSELKIGDQLLHNPLPVCSSTNNTISEDEAWVLGLFVAEGSCGTYEYRENNKRQVKHSWGLVNQNLDYLHKAKEILEICEPQLEWKILDCMASSAVYKLVPKLKNRRDYGSIASIVKKYRSLCYYKKSKIVPAGIFNSSQAVRMSFFEGYYMGDGVKESQANKGKEFVDMSYSFGIKSQISAATFCWLSQLMGFKFSIKDLNGKPNIYIMTLTKSGNAQMKDPVAIKKIVEFPPSDDYVYDLETENHHFSAGVGNLVSHNTDSLYLSVPEVTFAAHDKLYYTGKMDKLAYWTQMVEQTFVAINEVRDIVNETFVKDNGTNFLSMAYEEVMYPVAFTAKKKYFGIAHENIANFKPKDLFIRGLEVKKRGVSGLLKKIFTDIMWLCMSPDNLLSMLEITWNKINEIYNKKWDPSDFIQTDVFRPTKNNVKVRRFVERMKERGIIVKPNERFEYVIVKKYPFSYDYRGRKEQLGVGDKIEFVDIARNEGLDVDLDHYMQSSINGQLGRIIAYHEMFHVDALDTTPEELAVAETKIYKNACKFIDEYCKKYYSSYNTFGKTYQSMFKTANKIIAERVRERDQLASELLSANANLDDMEKWLVESSDKAAAKLSGNYGEEYVSAELAKIEDKNAKNEKLKLLQQIYYGNDKKCIAHTRETAYKETMNILRRRIRDSLAEINTIYRVYYAGIERITSNIRESITSNKNLFAATSNTESREYKLADLSIEIDQEELTTAATSYTNEMFSDVRINQILDKFKTLYADMVSAQITIKRTRSVVDYLKIRRNQNNRTIVRPDDDVMKQIIADGIKEALASDIEF